MASRRHTLLLAYPRRAVSTRSATRVDYHSLILVIGLLALAAFAGVLYLSQASVAAQLRFGLRQAEWQAEDLWEQNLALRQEISRAERLATIEERAGRLGMVNAPASGPYLACVVPQIERAGAPPAPEAAVSQWNQETRSNLWHGLLTRLGLVRQPGQLAALSGERR